MRKATKREVLKLIEQAEKITGQQIDRYVYTRQNPDSNICCAEGEPYSVDINKLINVIKKETSPLYIDDSCEFTEVVIREDLPDYVYTLILN